ncbi:hypothetical protein Hanom_Chr02g00150951 [Helianthus anomalus]
MKELQIQSDFSLLLSFSVGSGSYCMSISSLELYVLLKFWETFVILCYFETLVFYVLGLYYICSN